MSLEPRLILASLAAASCATLAACDVSSRPERTTHKPPPLEVPPQTPLSSPEVGPDGVLAHHLPDGTRVHNVFEVAMQALDGQAWLDGARSGLLPRLPRTARIDAPGQAEAYAWLEARAEPLGAGAAVWLYEFDNTYNDVSVEAPWPSAFGQAYVLWALLRRHAATNAEPHRALCMRAVRAFAVPVRDGGLQALLPDGCAFFEEVPTARSPHILNGHMVATLALLDAADALGDPLALSLAARGVATLEHHLADFDLGDWSRYDLNPKKGELLFRLLPEPPGAVIDVDRIVLRRADKIDEAVVLDVGADDDDRGAWRVFGGSWGGRQRRDGRTTRAVSGDDAGVILQLPRLVFDDWASVPAHELVVRYAARGAGELVAGVRDNRHGDVVRFSSLGALRALGRGTWRRGQVTVAATRLTWYMGPEYQAFHSQLLDALATRTGAPILAAAAVRWREYLEAHESTLTPR